MRCNQSERTWMALMRSVLSASASLRSKLTLERQFLAGWVERVGCAEGQGVEDRTELYREVEVVGRRTVGRNVGM